MRDELTINVGAHEVHSVHTVESLTREYLKDVNSNSKKQPVGVVIDGDMTAKQRATAKK